MNDWNTKTILFKKYSLILCQELVRFSIHDLLHSILVLKYEVAYIPQTKEHIIEFYLISNAYFSVTKNIYVSWNSEVFPRTQKRWNACKNKGSYKLLTAQQLRNRIGEIMAKLQQHCKLDPTIKFSINHWIGHKCLQGKANNLPL